MDAQEATKEFILLSSESSLSHKTLYTFSSEQVYFVLANSRHSVMVMALSRDPCSAVSLDNCRKNSTQVLLSAPFPKYVEEGSSQCSIHPKLPSILVILNCRMT
jgi:hypothetical protein